MRSEGSRVISSPQFFPRMMVCQHGNKRAMRFHGTDWGQMSCVIGRDKIKCIRKNCFSVMERVKVHHFRKSHAQRTSLEGGASVANHRSLRVIKGILEYPVSYWMPSKILESCVPSSRMCLGKMRALLPTTSIGGISQRLLY